MKYILGFLPLFLLSACSQSSAAITSELEGNWTSADNQYVDITEDTLTMKNAQYNYKITQGDIYLYLLDEQQDIPYSIIDVTRNQQEALEDAKTYYLDEDVLIFKTVTYYRDGSEQPDKITSGNSAARPETEQEPDQPEEEQEPEEEVEPATIVGTWRMDGTDIDVQFTEDGQVNYTDQIYAVSYAFDDYGQLILNVGGYDIVFLPAYSIDEAYSSKIYYFFNQENLVFGAQGYTRLDGPEEKQDKKEKDNEESQKTENMEESQDA